MAFYPFAHKTCGNARIDHFFYRNSFHLRLQFLLYIFIFDFFVDDPKNMFSFYSDSVYIYKTVIRPKHR